MNLGWKFQEDITYESMIRMTSPVGCLLTRRYALEEADGLISALM